jgi:Family of unknown function (DUF6011)
MIEMSTTTQRVASDKSTSYLTALAAIRPWQTVLDGRDRETVTVVFGNVDSPTPKFVGQRDVSAAIDAVLKIKPTAAATKPAAAVSDFTALQRLLRTLPLSKYALPRRYELETWDFFEVVERKKTGVRFLNRLIGAPGDWRREHLTVALQNAAARAVAEDPKSSAFEYARQHGRCSCCDAKLSDPKSIAQSMGPVCVKKFS